MMAVGLLWHLSWHWHVLAWSSALALLLLGWVGALVLTSLLGRRGSLLQRSLFPFGPAAIVLLSANLSLRLFERVQVSMGPGPQRWLLGWLPAPLHRVLPGVWVHPYDAIVIYDILGAGLVAASVVLFAVIDLPARHPPKLNAPLAGGAIASAVLFAAALLLPFLFYGVYREDTDRWWWIDLVALAPLIAICVGARLQARMPVSTPRQRVERLTTSQGPPPDIVSAWAKAGVLDPTRPALLDFEAHHRPQPPSPRASAAWAAVDAPGPPPAGLDLVLDKALDPDAVWLIGDLPYETEAKLFAAMLSDLVGAQAQRVLAVVAEPQPLADAVRAGLVRCHTWEPGVIAVGAEALQEAIARQRLPALVLVTPSDLSRQLVRVACGEGRIWASGLDLLLVQRPDVGTPIEVTHTTFTFRRWHLATQSLATPSVIATGADTAAVLSHLERLFPGREACRVQLAPRSQGATRVLRTDGDDRRNDPWVARATRAIADLDEPITLVDPSGAWGELSVGDTRVSVSRDITYPGRATVADLELHALAHAYRCIANRLDDPHGQTHFALWRVRSTPVTRFLLAPGRLGKLAEQRDLPTPKPVVGAENRFVRRAHLNAALHEGSPDERSLRRSFGSDIVDFVLRDTERSERHISQLIAGQVVRSPVLHPSAGQAWRDPHSTTVTNDVIAVVDERSGRQVATVDTRIAATRYYPQRVFAVDTRRYRVPIEALDHGRGQLRVVPAAVTDALTRPLLTYPKLDVRRTVVGRVTRTHRALALTTLTVEALVHEEVGAAWVPGQEQTDRFEPATASYDTELRLVFLANTTTEGLYHLARMVDALLPAHLRTDDEDAEVIPFQLDGRPCLAVIDRHIGGMGLARALDGGTLARILDWTRALLFSCSCLEGCPICTPEQVLRSGQANKQAVLQMLP